ncbi:hypothetical protein [Streptomyces sp. NPDC060198]|uniref:hypothetical protein n=1 Tax=Streptomyces sp. NPDC060198 TaxID=3347070 RepID=UPI00365DB6E0
MVSSSGGLVMTTEQLADGDRSVTLPDENASTATVSTTAAAAGLPAASSYRLTSLWSRAVSSTGGTITAAGELHLYNGAHCLDAYDGRTAPGTVVRPGNRNGGANQKRSLSRSLPNRRSADPVRVRTRTGSLPALPPGAEDRPQ